jgi:hypothetical protein
MECKERERKAKKEKRERRDEEGGMKKGRINQ